MLLTTLIIVVQEILEVSLVISLLLVFTRLRGLHPRWVLYGLSAGAAGAMLYAAQIVPVSESFDYSGQEITNASLHAGIYISLVFFTHLIHRSATTRHRVMLSGLMALVVALGLAREGFEILLYLSGLMTKPDLVTPLLVGTVLGTGISCSAGALFYYGLLSLRAAISEAIALLLVALFGGNMLSQAAQMLIQADLLPAGPTLWNSSAILAEDSLAGQLLYALIGYEATPTAAQLVAYMGGFGLLLALVVAGRRRFTH